MDEVKNEYQIDFGPYEVELKAGQVYFRKNGSLMKAMPVKSTFGLYDLKKLVQTVAKKVNMTNKLPKDVLKAEKDNDRALLKGDLDEDYVKPMHMYKSLTYKVTDAKAIMAAFKGSKVYKNRTNHFAIKSSGDTITISGHPQKGAQFTFDVADQIDSAIQKTGKAKLVKSDSKKLKQENKMTESERVFRSMIREMALPMLKEHKLTEGKKFKPGDMWSDDFDYKGMMVYSSKAKLSLGLNTLNKLSNSLEDVNYHTENKPLWNAITALKTGDKKGAEDWIKTFNKLAATTARTMKEGYLIESLSSSDVKKATDAIKAYVKKYKKDADGEVKDVAKDIGGILRWNDSKIKDLVAYLYKLNKGSTEIIFGESKYADEPGEKVYSTGFEKENVNELNRGDLKLLQLALKGAKQARMGSSAEKAYLKSLANSWRINRDQKDYKGWTADDFEEDAIHYIQSKR